MTLDTVLAVAGTRLDAIIDGVLDTYQMSLELEGWPSQTIQALVTEHRVALILSRADALEQLGAVARQMIAADRIVH